MAKIDVKCPTCNSIEVSKFGKSTTGKQRYICNHKECRRKTFQLEHSYHACKPHIEEQIVSMTANASGIRDISRVLKISTYKVMSTLKKQKRQLETSIQTIYSKKKSAVK